MCHFFLIPHYDTKHLRCIRGQRRKRTWQTSKHVTFWKIHPYVPKWDTWKPRAFHPAPLKLGWQRRQWIQLLTPRALCPASGEWTLWPPEPYFLWPAPRVRACSLFQQVHGGAQQPPAFCSAFFLPPVVRGLLVTQIKLLTAGDIQMWSSNW